jgi:hypothetical protein
MFVTGKPHSGGSTKTIHFIGKCNETKKQLNNQSRNTILGI